MDLSKLDTAGAADKGATLTLRHPGTNHLMPDCTITLIGRDASEVQESQKRVMDRRLNAGISKGKLKLSTAEMEEDNIAILVQCTRGWEGIEERNEKLACTPENVRKVYTNYSWIREQVEDFVGERANFLAR